jgi:hypothetical protein
MDSAGCSSGNCQDSPHIDCLNLTTLDRRLRLIIEAWSDLSEDERNTFAASFKIACAPTFAT